MPEPKASDPAEHCLSDVPIARWDAGQARQWLLTVSAGAFDEFAQSLVAHLEAQKPKSSQSSRYAVNQPFLGTTTIEGRKKIFDGEGNNSNAGSGGITVGQLLVTLTKYPAALGTTPESERHFLNAIKRRNEFELRKRTALEEIEKERKRLTQDTASANVTSKVVFNGQVGSNHSTADSKVASAEASHQASSTEVDLNSLFGGEVIIKTDIVPVVTAPSRPLPVASAAVSSASNSNGSKAPVPSAAITIQVPSVPASTAPEPAIASAPVAPPPKKKKMKINILDE